MVWEVCFLVLGEEKILGLGESVGGGVGWVVDEGWGKRRGVGGYVGIGGGVGVVKVRGGGRGIGVGNGGGGGGVGGYVGVRNCSCFFSCVSFDFMSIVFLEVGEIRGEDLNLGFLSEISLR